MPVMPAGSSSTAPLRFAQSRATAEAAVPSFVAQQKALAIARAFLGEGLSGEAPMGPEMQGV
jgi:hypothetical protein